VDDNLPLSIEVENITVVYNNGHVAVQDASFRLDSGSITALVGANGSGKSTIFKAIMGFVSPLKGQVRIAGRPARESMKQNVLAYVPQSEEVDWTFPVSVHDVVMMGRYRHMNFLRRPAKSDRLAVAESLNRVDLWEFRDRQIGELSGGQKKRVFLARALAQQGRVMLLDEPFTGVDVKTEVAIISLLRELRDAGHILLVSTHNLGAVPDFCDGAVIINRTVLAAGPISKVFSERNIAEAFGGVLRRFDVAAESGTDTETGRRLTVMTDDERPLIFGRGGQLDFTSKRKSDDA
jgi:manganese/iron transport system ATP-binding protein